MNGYDYPSGPHVRRHGPQGYRNYESYRDWLRDEFMFRCVYCLQREQWYGRSGAFHIDHFVPVSVDPGKKCEYSNVLYACSACNEAKGDAVGMPNPCDVTLSKSLRVKNDGSIKPLNRDGELLVRILRLNSESNVRYRSQWMRKLRTLREFNRELYEEFLGFPENLPDLRRKRVKNTKPNGAQNCYFALRERGELPRVY